MNSYSVVIATRNRLPSLTLSVPLLLGQSRPPLEVIVVDSSDDGDAVAEMIEREGRETDVPLRYIRSEAGSSLQRNIGVRMAKGDVVMFPDDDSLLFPDTMERIMAVYDRDAQEAIGGVGGIEASDPPPGVLETRAAYDMTRSDRVKASIARQRYDIQDRLAPDPLVLLAHSLNADRSVPDWLGTANAKVVPYLTGFRMSFRRAIIEKVGFNETLGRYALFEDIDASLAVQKTHFLVAAVTADIYHHKSPERRTSGYALGAMHILNRAYVFGRQGGAQQPGLIRALRRHGRMKIAQYALGLRSRFGRDRFAGAIKAYRRQMALLKAEPGNLTAVYQSMRNEVLTGKGA